MFQAYFPDTMHKDPGSKALDCLKPFVKYYCNLLDNFDECSLEAKSTENFRVP